MRTLPLAALALASIALADMPPVRPPLELPSGSAEYRNTVKLIHEYTLKKKLTLAQLTKAVVALELKRHPLGCEYYWLSPSPPPPGITFEPKLMPADWVGTFGEVAMTHLGGWGLTRADYDTLHKAAHGKQPGFPNCGKPKTK